MRNASADPQGHSNAWRPAAARACLIAAPSQKAWDDPLLPPAEARTLRGSLFVCPGRCERVEVPHPAAERAHTVDVGEGGLPRVSDCLHSQLHGLWLESQHRVDGPLPGRSVPIGPTAVSPAVHFSEAVVGAVGARHNGVTVRLLGVAVWSQADLVCAPPCCLPRGTSRNSSGDRLKRSGSLIAVVHLVGWPRSSASHRGIDWQANLDEGTRQHGRLPLRHKLVPLNGSAPSRFVQKGA